VWSADKEREPVPIGSDAERPLPDARRDVAGAPKGNKNALKHGRHTTESIALRREISGLVRLMKALASKSDIREA